MIEHGTKKEINYPAELIFKSIFRNRPYTMECIRNILAESLVPGEVVHRESSGGKFISYTVTAVFPSEDTLNSVCSKITTLEGYMSLF
ncbi:MAG TPA: DUF493 family protein [Spirochaetota bacterium]|nr:DUF493 family protein [Spirochaetota bacterium]